MTTRTEDDTPALEQQVRYHVHTYLAGGRIQDAVFTMPRLRGWMLSQSWPAFAPSRQFELLVVLTWNAICTVDEDPEQEVIARGELGRQLDYLQNETGRRPVSLEHFQAQHARRTRYITLREASEPRATARGLYALPRAKSTKYDRT